MHVVAVYALTLAAAGAAGGTVAIILNRSLREVIVDLCGTPARARFWTRYLSILLVLAPAFAASFALPFEPGYTGMKAVAILTLLALVVALLVIGLQIQGAVRPHVPAPIALPQGK